MVPTEPEVVKARKEAERAVQARRWAEESLEQERRSHAQTKGKLARLAKRIEAGVCPCCNSTFQNLARHMKTKHPEAAGAEAKA